MILLFAHLIVSLQMKYEKRNEKEQNNCVDSVNTNHVVTYCRDITSQGYPST
jgi:hypothetical protein